MKQCKPWLDAAVCQCPFYGTLGLNGLITPDKNLFYPSWGKVASPVVKQERSPEIVLVRHSGSLGCGVLPLTNLCSSISNQSRFQLHPKSWVTQIMILFKHESFKSLTLTLTSIKEVGLTLSETLTAVSMYQQNSLRHWGNISLQTLTCNFSWSSTGLIIALKKKKKKSIRLISNTNQSIS